MDEIFQILIFVGAMIFSVIIQSTKKKKEETPSPHEVLEEMFPDTVEFQEAMPIDVQLDQKPISPPRRKPFKTQIKSETVKSTAFPTVTKKQSKVCLNSKEDARRAFIYSEIFNRKY